MGYDLTPGVIDGAAEEAFTGGACAGLALALHDLTDWPLFKVTDAAKVYPADGYDTLENADLTDRANPTNTVGMGAGGLHWGVLHPSGRFLDVDGLHDPADIVERYDGDAGDGVAALGVTTRDDAEDEYVHAKGEPVPLPLAATFVRPVLERAGLRPDWGR